MLTHVRAVPLTGSDQLVITGQMSYCGFTVRETAGAVASFRVYDNTSATGTLLDTVSLAANESWSEVYTRGIWCQNGIYVDVLAGTIEGSLRLG